VKVARIKYTRIPVAGLYDLTDMEVRILDLALGTLQDRVDKDPTFLVGGAYEREQLVKLHRQILIIKRGEDEVEE
jgi:hypothetical protein